MRPVPAISVFKAIDFHVQAYSNQVVDQGQVGVMTRILDQVGQRKAILAWLFPDLEYPDERSIKTLSPAMLYALSRWIDPQKTETGWEPSDQAFFTEAQWIIDAINLEKNGPVGAAKRLGGVVVSRDSE